jgi:S-adenosylmethionine:tRNA ribosyltransferase-isomerase
MLTEDFDYDLPHNLIAQTPLPTRDDSRLLVVNRESGALTHTYFRFLPNFLTSGDILVINDTRVVPSRLKAKRIPTGGTVELLLLQNLNPTRWLSMCNPSKSMQIGQIISIGPSYDSTATVIGYGRDNSERIIEFDTPISLNDVADLALPPYIKHTLSNPDRYQTVYADTPGSIAAPTAGLHFTNELLTTLMNHGVEIVKVTLHVNKGTFVPIKTANPKDHILHSEYCSITEEAASTLNKALSEGRRIIAVGTTSVRTLEQAPLQNQAFVQNIEIQANSRMTNLYILPGFNFRVISGLVTNFHLPKSSLLMLVSAFTGNKLTKHAYSEAIANNYRFYSFGDAMLVV